MLADHRSLIVCVMDIREPEQLILRHLAGETTPDEDAALMAWRNAAPERAQQFNQLHALWDRTAPKRHPLPVDIGDEWARLQRRLHAPPVIPRRLRRFQWAVAASVALLIAVGVWWQLREPPAVSPQMATAPPGTTLAVPLADGSAVQLAGGSTLRWEDIERGANRTVTLTGEAYFDVASGERPFIVETATAHVRVLGTAFAVRTQPTGTYVAVREGRVRLQGTGPERPSLDLAAGEAAALQTETGLRRLSSEQQSASLAWLQGTQAFEQRPLAEVVRDLSRYYGQPVRLAPTADSTLSVTFRVENDALADVVEILALTVGYQVIQDNSGFVLRPPTP